MSEDGPFLSMVPKRGLLWANHPILSQLLHFLICRGGYSFTQRIQNPSCVLGTYCTSVPQSKRCPSPHLALGRRLWASLPRSSAPSCPEDWEASEACTTDTLQGGSPCTPHPTPFLGPVGENPALRVFISPPFPQGCIKQELCARVWVRCPTERVAGSRPCSQRVPHCGGNGHKNESLH